MNISGVRKTASPTCCRTTNNQHTRTNRLTDTRGDPAHRGPVHPLWPQTPEQCPIPTIRGSHAPSCNFALIREVRSRTTPPRLHTLSCLITFIFWVELSGGSENLL